MNTRHGHHGSFSAVPITINWPRINSISLKIAFVCIVVIVVLLFASAKSGKNSDGSTSSAQQPSASSVQK